MNRYLMGLDIGTSACKVALFSLQGDAVAEQTRQYPIYRPQEGWAEQNPEEWWNAACEGIRGILRTSQIDPRAVAGIGVAGQGWAAVMVDENGQALGNTPIWMDLRAKQECGQMKALMPSSAWFGICGNPVQPSYTLPKVLWYKNHLPAVLQKAVSVLQSNGYLVCRLTGALSLDRSQGYGWQCFHMHTGQWDEGTIEKLGLPRSLLPEIFDCCEVVGRVTPQAAALTGLAEGTPVVAGGLDAACGTLGAGVVHPGQTQEQGGQAGGMSLCLDSYKSEENLILGFHVIPGQWLLQGGTTGGGGALKWLQETLCSDWSFRKMDESAQTIPPGSDGVCFLPYMAGERSPIWNPHAKGVFFGLDFAKTKAHFVRAVMEGVGYSLRHNLDTAEKAQAKVKTLRSIGGGARSPLWLQMKADITGKVIEVTKGDTETTLGAAILAGVGVGIYPDFAGAVEQTVRVTHTVRPNPDTRAAYAKGYRQYLQLYRLLEPMMTGEKAI